MSGERRDLVPLGEIAARLAARALSLAAELLPGGKRVGAEWVVGSAASPWGCSVSVHLSGPKAGLWSAWAAGIGGDALDLIMAVRFGTILRQSQSKQAQLATIAWAKNWLGEAALTSAVEPRKSNPTSRAKTEVSGDAETRRTRDAAVQVWFTARPSLRDTPAEAYLRGRGIDLMALGRQPRALRYHPSLYHAESGRHWPALVALVCRGSEAVGVHRTWLAPASDAPRETAWGKAPVEPAKKSWGPVRGGAVRLWRGAGGRPLRDAAAGETVIVAEGIEDGLSCVIGTGQYRVFAALSLANMAALELPATVTTVIVAAQNDRWWHDRLERPHPTSQGLDRAVRHFQSQGRQVRLARPEQGKDLNDLLRGAA